MLSAIFSGCPAIMTVDAGQALHQLADGRLLTIDDVGCLFSAGRFAFGKRSPLPLRCLRFFRDSLPLRELLISKRVPCY